MFKWWLEKMIKKHHLALTYCPYCKGINFTVSRYSKNVTNCDNIVEAYQITCHTCGAISNMKEDWSH